MAVFPSTRWSLIHASDLSNGRIAGAWGELFRTYQPAITGYFRRHAMNGDADDLAQEFFTRSMSEAWWSRADPTAGSFRQFLLVLLKRFCAGHQRYGHRQWETMQSTFDESCNHDTPDRRFDIDFAACITQEAITQLRAEYERDNRAALFDSLLPLISEMPMHGDLGVLGRRLSVAPNTLSVQLKRLRIRLQKTIRGLLLRLAVDDAHAQADLNALRLVLGEHTA